MLRGLYTAATNMVVQRRRVDVIANNIANMDTTGFKADTLISNAFSDMLLRQVGSSAATAPSVGSLNNGVYADDMATNFEEGSLRQTERKADIAINGGAFFAVSTTAGERYTRDGSFVVDSEGYLATSDGNRVAGTNGLLKVGNANFTVDGRGDVKDEKGNAVGTLKLVSFEKTSELKKAGGSLFVNASNQPAKTDTDSAVMQGYLETSNTDVTSEMLNMMSASRLFETSQRVVKMIDETLGRAVNDIGKV